VNDTRQPEDLPLRQVLLLVGVQTVFFVALGYGLWAVASDYNSRFISFAPWELGLGASLAAALVAFSAALAFLFPRFADWLVRSQARQYPFMKHGLSLPAILFISLCAGLGEEVLFRAGVQTWLGQYMPFVLALAVASALFSVIHFAHPLNSALIFIIGCVFGLVYWQTGSLTAVITGHALYDVYAIWALQRAMHRLGVFNQGEIEGLPDAPLRETVGTDITGEDKQS